MRAAMNDGRLRRLAALALASLSWLSGSPLERTGVAVAAAQAPAGDGAVAGQQHFSRVVAECVEHHTSAQELRMDGKLLESRAAMRRCAAPECPALLQNDCTTWLGQIETQIPSLVFHLTVDGQRRADSRVLIDGEIAEQSGEAVDLDPGPHRLRVEVPGLAPYEEEVVLSEGERHRTIEVALASPPRRAPPPPLPKRELHRPIPTASLVLGGVGIAGLLSGTIWGASSLALRSDLEATCAPACSDERVSDLRRRALITDVSWGVAALSLAGAATFYILRPEVPVEVGVSLQPGGGVGHVWLQAF